MERIGETVNVVDPSYPNQLFDMTADVNLVFKWLEPGVYRETWKQLDGPKIVYQVDDLRFSHIKDMMQEMRKFCDHALTFDEDGAKLAKSYGYGSAQRLLLTADNQLYRPIDGMPKDIDVSFVGSLSHGDNHRSRMRMIEIVKGMGLKFLVANELFDIPRLNQIYNRSKVVLNHATDVGQPFGHGYGYQCRHFEAGFAGACVLSNEIDNDKTLTKVMTYSNEEELVKVLRWLVDNPLMCQVFGREGLYEELTAGHTPEHRANELVNFVRSL